MYSKLFYDTVFEVTNSLRVPNLGVKNREKWMTSPGMSFLITSIYNVILFSWSINLNITFLTLVVSPSMFASRHKIIAVGYVNNSIELNTSFILSRLTKYHGPSHALNNRVVTKIYLFQKKMENIDKTHKEK